MYNFQCTICKLWGNTVTCVWLSVIEEVAYRATLITQFSVTQKRLAAVNDRVSLLLIQVLQFINVVLALRFSLSHVDVRQNSLDYNNL